jgi:Rgg/GadR/MutR family transcriptional activator
MFQYGEYFRQVREEKGMTLQEVASGITTPSFLSRFERNKSSISIDLLLPLLEKLNTKFDEFALMAGIKPMNRFYARLNEIAIAHQQNDIDGLLRIVEDERHLFIENGENHHQHLAVVAEAAIADATGTLLSSATQTNVLTYLFGVEKWGQYELSIFASVTGFIVLNSQKLLIRELLEKRLNTEMLVKHEQLISMAIINIIIQQLESRYVTSAIEVLSQFKSAYGNTANWEYLLRVKFLEGIILIEQGAVNDGTNLANKAIEAMVLIGQENVASNHKSFLKQILE